MVRLSFQNHDCYILLSIFYFSLIYHYVVSSTSIEYEPDNLRPQIETESRVKWLKEEEKNHEDEDMCD